MVHQTIGPPPITVCNRDVTNLSVCPCVTFYRIASNYTRNCEEYGGRDPVARAPI